jgi:hypothetical protein
VPGGRGEPANCDPLPDERAWAKSGELRVRSGRTLFESQRAQGGGWSLEIFFFPTPVLLSILNGILSGLGLLGIDPSTAPELLYCVGMGQRRSTWSPLCPALRSVP